MQKRKRTPHREAKRYDSKKARAAEKAAPTGLFKRWGRALWASQVMSLPS